VESDHGKRSEEEEKRTGCPKENQLFDINGDV
jgi:hypothetical protein